MGGVHLHVRTCAPIFHKCFACCYSVTVGRLRWNLVCTWRPISESLCSSHEWGISARAHVRTAILYLRNGSADCVKKFGVRVWGHYLSALHKSWVGCIRTCTRAHVHTPFLYLGNRWAYCAEIHKLVVRVPVTVRFIQVISWVPLHMRTCTPHLHISITDWPIVLKCDAWLETQQWWTGMRSRSRSRSRKKTGRLRLRKGIQLWKNNGMLTAK